MVFHSHVFASGAHASHTHTCHPHTHTHTTQQQHSTHSWPSPVDGVREIHRVLKPGGKFFASTFLTGYFTQVNKAGGQFNQFENTEALAQIVEEAGFDKDSVKVELRGSACVIIRATKTSKSDSDSDSDSDNDNNAKSETNLGTSAADHDPKEDEKQLEIDADTPVTEAAVVTTPADQQTGDNSETDLVDRNKMTVANLKAECEARGLSTWGKKKVLIERLNDAEKAEE